MDASTDADGPRSTPDRLRCARGRRPAGRDAAPAETATSEEDALVAALAEPWTGDLDGIVERGYLRFGVAYNPILFSYDGPHQQGLSVDLAAEFEKHLRQTLGK